MPPRSVRGAVSGLGARASRLLLAGDARAGDDLVVEVERQLAARREVLQQREDVAGVELAGVVRHLRRQVREADDRDALAHDLLARLGQLAVAAGLGGEVDDAAARAHVRDRRGGDEPRRRAARDERGRDHDVEVGQALLERRLLLRLLLRRQLVRVAALGLLAVTPSSRKRAPSDSTCSFTAGRTSNAETTAPRRRAVAIACRPGDAGAEHEHAGRRDRAGGGHQHREEPGHAVGGDQHGLVAGDGRLRGERVHRLGARDPRDRLHREARRRRAARGARCPRCR